MAYTKRYTKKRYNRSKRSSTPWYRKKYDALALAQKAAQGVYYLKGLVNSEMLHVDTSLILGSNQSQIFSLTQIAQNDTDSGRTGNSILLRNIYVRGLIEINPSVSANSRVMIALVQDTQQVADTTPAVLDVFKTNSPESMLAMPSAGRFKMIYRKTFTLSPASGGRNAIEFTKYWKMRQHIRYNSTANTDIQKNGYYLIVITSEVTNFPSVALTSRVGYHDN